MGSEMTVLHKGSFSLNLGFVSLSGDLSDDDRQCAWELYSELSTRVAVTGKPSDPDCTDFDGELYVESLESLYRFFQEARGIMRRFSVGRLERTTDQHLGVMISRAMSDVLRPFLEKWQVKFRHWWEDESNPRLPPLRRQQEYPDLAEFLADWSAVRWLMCQLQAELVRTYKLVDVSNSKRKEKGSGQTNQS
jgi:hypothetical protein